MTKGKPPLEKLLEEGYREMAEEHLAWAKMVFPIVREMWLSTEKELILKDAIFDRFITACAKARKPNKALLGIANLTEDKE